MATGKFILIIVTLVVFINVCNCNILRDILEKLFEHETGQRSMSDAITNYLDYIFPKDDKESKIMKELFGFFADDSHPGLEGAMDALHYLTK
ncbi:hypothetical protein KGM_208333 [Danaus plexippus plexippus]|uniref:Uncharacterized protein n=1 Tax=Danaus plexippus plexippus TaxID=278856 RepID=A0A212FLZ9_DANPL|nr:hypothetical protein KGM_208333 [Danaus plexippus plexippus]